MQQNNEQIDMTTLLNEIFIAPSQASLTDRFISISDTSYAAPCTGACGGGGGGGCRTLPFC